MIGNPLGAWFKCYPDDFIAGCRGLSDREIGYYTIVVMHMYSYADAVYLSDADIGRMLKSNARGASTLRESLIAKGKLHEIVGEDEKTGLINLRAVSVMLENIADSFTTNRHVSENISIRIVKLSENFRECFAKDIANLSEKLNKNKVPYKRLETRIQIQKIQKKGGGKRTWCPTRAQRKNGSTIRLSSATACPPGPHGSRARFLCTAQNCAQPMGLPGLVGSEILRAQSPQRISGSAKPKRGPHDGSALQRHRKLCVRTPDLAGQGRMVTGRRRFKRGHSHSLKKKLCDYSQVHLYAGIGGFGLAARLAGVPDEFRLFTAGFPCQPFSNAGVRRGTDDNRYLWPETLAALLSHGPDVAILENVAGLVTMAFPGDDTLMDVQDLAADLRDYHYQQKTQAVIDRIACDLEEAGYTVQALVIPACATDAKHRRDRIWIVCFRNDLAYCNDGLLFHEKNKIRARGDAVDRSGSLANASFGRCHQSEDGQSQQPGGTETLSSSETLADTNRTRQPQYAETRNETGNGAVKRGERSTMGNTASPGSFPASQPGIHSKTKSQGARNAELERRGRARSQEKRERRRDDQKHTGTWGRRSDNDRCSWPVEPDVGRVVDGLSGRVDRIKGLGNAIVAQVAAEIMTHILAALGIEPEYKIPPFEAWFESEAA